VTDVNAMCRCQGCGNVCQTRYVTFYRNVGMLFRRQTHTIHGDMCRSCVHKRFWEFTAKNVLLGPWGTISMIVTPIYLLQNVGSYLVTLYKLRDALE
jgi:coenzyme F420-reducing hydrogenase beta subunit